MDGAATQSVTGLPFQAGGVWVIKGDAHGAVERTVTMATTLPFAGLAGLGSSGVQNLEDSAFQVGTDPGVNETGETYTCMAWPAAAVSLDGELAGAGTLDGGLADGGVLTDGGRGGALGPDGGCLGLRRFQVGCGCGTVRGLPLDAFVLVFPTLLSRQGRRGSRPTDRGDAKLL